MVYFISKIVGIGTRTTCEKTCERDSIRRWKVYGIANFIDALHLQLLAMAKCPNSMLKNKIHLNWIKTFKIVFFTKNLSFLIICLTKSVNYFFINIAILLFRLHHEY